MGDTTRGKQGSPSSAMLLAAGMSCLYVWLFIAFPAFGPATSLGTDIASHAILRLLSSGLLSGILVTACASFLRSPETRAWVMGSSALLMVLGEFLLPSSLGTQGDLTTLMVSYALLGGGLGIGLVFWGALMCRRDVERNERTFVAVFALSGATLLIASVTPSPLASVLKYVLPVIGAALFVRCDASSDSTPGFGADNTASGTTKESSGDVVSETIARADCPENSVVPVRSIVPLLIRTGVAISFVSAAWDVIASNAAASNVMLGTAFAIGMMLAAGGLWIFTKYSASVGFSASVRWALPVLTLGMALGVFETTPAVMCACIVTAGAHTFFETILRLQVIRFAQDDGRPHLRSVGMGYIAIMFGSMVGSIIYHLVNVGFAGDYAKTVVCLLAAAVACAVFVFGDSLGAGGRDSGPGESSTTPPAVPTSPSEVLATQFGLSQREREVLAFLLQGRSRPYIRDDLHISISTVDTHIRHIYEKTGVANRQELIDLAEGIGSPEGEKA